MRKFRLLFACVIASAVLATTRPATGQDSGDWLDWRGPNRNGITAGQTPPTTWSEEENIVWKAEVTGRGHASPCIAGNQIVIATADNAAEKQYVASYDFESGAKLWETLVNEGNFPKKIYPTNTHASSTVVCDGKNFYAVLCNNDKAQVVALDGKGNILWQKHAAPFKPKMYQFGFGASPVLYGDNLIVPSECEREGAIVCLRCSDGEEVYRIDRFAATSYSTPSIATVAGKEQLLMSGGSKVDSYNPKTGELLWSAKAPWAVSCGTPVWDQQNVYVSGGYPASRTFAVKADGSGEIVWENPNNSYEQSMLIHDGYIYATTENGSCVCTRASDGEEMWKTRMDAKISASPVLANGNIYISAENGVTWVFRATHEGYEEVAKNTLGNTAYATPSFVRNNIIARVATGEGKDKTEYLYRIGTR